MKCRRYRKLFIPYLEGALPERFRLRMEEHLLLCPACARELEDVKDISAALAGAACPETEPLPDTRERVMARIQGMPAARRWPRMLISAYSAGAAAVLLLAAVLVTSDFREPREVAQVPRERVAASKPARQPAVPAKRPAQPAKTAVAEAPALPHKIKLKALPALPRFASRPKSTVASAQKPPASHAPRIASAKIVEKPDAAAEPLAQYRNVQAPPGGGQQMLTTTSPPTAEGMAGYGNSAPQGPAAPQARSTFSSADVKRAEKVAADFPTSRTALLNLLAACKDSGRKEDEYAAAERLTSLFPDEAAYWFARGQAAEKTGRKQDAADSYKRAVDLKLPSPDLETAKSRLLDLGL